MFQTSLIPIDRVQESTISALETRDIVLWLREIPKVGISTAELAEFIGLPWKLVIVEQFDQPLIDLLESSAHIGDPLARKRGFVQTIESDPSRIALPERCLPLYLLNGRSNEPNPRSYENRLRHATMIESLRRSAPREILVVADQAEPIPEGLTDLWMSGFRCFVTFTSPSQDASQLVEHWVKEQEGSTIASLLVATFADTARETVRRYESTYPEERKVLRIRDVRGAVLKLDITTADEPERPVLEQYDIIGERDLSYVTPGELSEEEFVTFFKDTTASWRPYAAGVPWIRDPEAMVKLSDLLKRLDNSGAEENCIAYIVAASGAGGTTLARALAWQCAARGYPCLVARQAPFTPDALPIVNYLTRIHVSYQSRGNPLPEASGDRRGREAVLRRYEAPWVIVFDTLHWQFRDAELLRFRTELEKAGRPVCLLVVAGPSLPISYYVGPHFKKIAELTHVMQTENAGELGSHLNKFLNNYPGKTRSIHQWQQFYQDHSVKYLSGVATFWVALSFWIQGHYDLSESIQEWIYRCFQQNVTEAPIKEAILRIAALSSARLPMPESLLPPSEAAWPISQLLDDARQSLSALGLVRIASDGEKYWALVHDIIGRLLINALFYDFQRRNELGYGEARDTEELRFMLLRKTSREPLLGERALRPIGEDFATTIFKIDPDHGSSNFVPIWREVLAALDGMPRGLRDSSRLFRHHCAVSRRRIAHLDERFYGPNLEGKASLLKQAVEDIKYALDFIEYTPGSESNVNLLNSLANAYIDLANVEASLGATGERLAELRKLANDATRRAYSESPTNSFVVETYVKNLLQSARSDTSNAVEDCVEALGILFSAMSVDEAQYRASKLGVLSTQALDILLRHTSDAKDSKEPQNAVDVLVQAWRSLVHGIEVPTLDLSEIPATNRDGALKCLEHSAGRGNIQVVRLTYELVCANQPNDYRRQLELLEQLVATDIGIAPQLRLEYAILLFQNRREQEGSRVFRDLRKLWRESDHIVFVAERLRWLRDSDKGELRTVNASIGADSGIRAAGRVFDFGTVQVPLRPEEFGFRELNMGMRFACHVSFNHNGPFLRPVTAGPKEAAQVSRA